MAFIRARSAPAIVALLVWLLAASGTHVAAAADKQFDWPLSPRPDVVRAFDKPAQNWLPGHRGVDLGATIGQEVLAAGSGVIAFAGVVAGKPTMSVDHPGGLRTTYEPVEAVLARGDRVTLGTVIGTLAAGHDGCSASACLHWGLRRGRDYLDPLGLIHDQPLRLKPVSQP